MNKPTAAKSITVNLAIVDLDAEVPPAIIGKWSGRCIAWVDGEEVMWAGWSDPRASIEARIRHFTVEIHEWLAMREEGYLGLPPWKA
jgi:acyl-CoA synthetase (AMP-forming)/AMP-acid ligase II